MSTTSTSSRSTAFVQSVSVWRHPHRSANVFRVSGLRPQATCRTGSAPRSKNLAAWLHPFEWALPMKFVPMIAILRGRFIRSVQCDLVEAACDLLQIFDTLFDHGFFPLLVSGVAQFRSQR